MMPSGSSCKSNEAAVDHLFLKKKIIVLSVARGFAAGCVRKPGNDIGDGGCVRKFGVRVARADAASFSRNPYLRLLLFGKKKSLAVRPF